MIRQHQPIGRNEAGRAAPRDSGRRQTHMLKPLRVGPETVLLTDHIGWEIIEGPHPFIGRQELSYCQPEKNTKKKTRFHYNVLMRWYPVVGTCTPVIYP